MTGNPFHLRRYLLLVLLVSFSGLFAQEEIEPVAAVADEVDLYAEQLAKPIESTKGRFVGKAYDAKSGKPLVGVGIQIEDTGAFTITDDKGRFIIDAVEPGTYTIVISQGGYEPVRAEEVLIKSGQVSNLASATGALERAPIETSDEIYEMEEIEVVSELVEEGAESLLFDRKELEQLITSMGKEEFSKVGAGDVISAV
ncbi:MAG: carboxypeptidase-like regulatory domain-containing protein, partial [Verrucomicrobiales bacterium]|nr:carboxypeptidase-like regulatory domain-containing protein [Verrucomicrobiales bacterium]